MTAVAMVLAAGRGRRMRPLSDVVPKPALPLPGGPVIRSALAQAAACGVARIVVNSWHLQERLEDAVRSAPPPEVQLAFSREPELLGGAGGLAAARDRGLLGEDGPVLVLNGDVVLRLDLAPLLSRASAGRDLVTLALIPHLDPHRWAHVLVAADGTVTGFRPPGAPAPGEVPLLYPGAMVVSRDSLDRLPPGQGEIMAELWRPALEQGRLGGEVVTGQWREVGTPEDYLDAVLARTGGGPLTDPAATVDPAASVGRAWIGPGAVVESGAVVGESVVTAGARVGAGARVFRSVLLGPVAVDAGEVVADHHLAGPPPPSATGASVTARSVASRSTPPSR